ncbi:MAG: hypothetical protein ACKPJJ_16610, partial [Planctomycetaceae bacterium]
FPQAQFTPAASHIGLPPARFKVMLLPFEGYWTTMQPSGQFVPGRSGPQAPSRPNFAGFTQQRCSHDQL